MFGNLSFDPSRPLRWMDLGCGTGTFTQALAELLAPGSSITVVDIDAQVLQHIPAEHRGIHITTHVAEAATMGLRYTSGIDAFGAHERSIRTYNVERTRSSIGQLMPTSCFRVSA